MKTEELFDEIRRQRNILLNESDWIQYPKGILSCDMYSKWISYRQALRDITISVEDPTKVVFPTPPVEDPTPPVEDPTPPVENVIDE